MGFRSIGISFCWAFVLTGFRSDGPTRLGLPGEAGFISVKARRKSTDNPTMGVRTQGQMSQLTLLEKWMRN